MYKFYTAMFKALWHSCCNLSASPCFGAQKSHPGYGKLQYRKNYRFSIFRQNISVFGNHRDHFLKHRQCHYKFNLFFSGFYSRFITCFWHFSVVSKNSLRKRCTFSLFVLPFACFLVILYNIKHFSPCVNGIILNMYGKMLDILKSKRSEA